MDAGAGGHAVLARGARDGARSAALACAALAAVLLAPAGAAAQGQAEALHTLSGRIEIEGGSTPSERLEVSLRPLLGGAQRVVFSDPGGRFVFDGVRAGTYVAAVDPPEVAPFEAGSAEVQVQNYPTPSTFFVTVTLRPKAAAGAPPLGGRTIDAAESDDAVPKRARDEYRRGARAAARGRTDEAIRHYRAALAAAPEYLFALNDLGVALTRAGRHAEAADVLRRAVALAPDSFPPRLNLAISLLGARAYADASSSAARAAEIDPSAPEPHFVDARAARALGDRERAAAAYERSFRLGGFDLAIAQFELGQLYEEMGQPEAAARAYAAYLTIERSGARADVARARLRALGVKTLGANSAGAG